MCYAEVGSLPQLIYYISYLISYFKFQNTNICTIDSIRTHLLVVVTHHMWPGLSTSFLIVAAHSRNAEAYEGARDMIAGPLG